MPSISAVAVKAVRKDKGGFKLIDDQWYSPDTARKGTKYNDLVPGDVVSFDYTVNGTWNNISSDVTKAGGSTGGGARKGGASADAGFPVPALHYSRSIIRQNCLGHATKVIIAKHEKSMPSLTKLSEEIIEVARNLESFAAGDLEAEEAKKIMEGEDSA